MPDSVAKKEIKALLLPVGDKNLMLPNANIAEVVSALTVEEKPIDEDGFLGLAEWRGFDIPVFSIEGLCDVERNQYSQTNYAVLYSLSETSQSPYYALEINGIPHFKFISEDKISLNDSRKPNWTFIAHDVTIESENAYIPNVEKLEEEVNRVFMTL